MRLCALSINKQGASHKYLHVKTRGSPNHKNNASNYEDLVLVILRLFKPSEQEELIIKNRKTCFDEIKFKSPKSFDLFHLVTVTNIQIMLKMCFFFT